MTLKQFLRSSLKFPRLLTTEWHAYNSRGKINIWSHMGEERPKKPQKINRNLQVFCGRIESIKSACSRSKKVTLQTCPGYFLETLISCPIYISKNAIFREYPSETSLQLLHLLSVCYFCPLLESWENTWGSCLSVDRCEFISTNMGQNFSVPIQRITRLVLKKSQTRKFELWVCAW